MDRRKGKAGEGDRGRGGVVGRREDVWTSAVLILKSYNTGCAGFYYFLGKKSLNPSS